MLPTERLQKALSRCQSESQQESNCKTKGAKFCQLALHSIDSLVPIHLDFSRLSPTPLDSLGNSESESFGPSFALI